MSVKTKVKVILLMSFIILGALSMKCFATSISVSPSKRTVSPGESFSVTISGSDATGRVNISASNGTVSQSSAWIENSSVTVTVKAGSSGTVNVSVSGELSSNAGIDKPVSGSTSVSIQTPSKPNNGGNQGGSNTSSGNNGGTSNSGGNTSSGGNQGGSATTQAKDNNANLKSLGINPNDFSGFSSGKTSYSVNVPNNVTSVNVYATASSSKARVSGTGARNLQEGTNIIRVTVTAEAGNSKTYTISVNRAGESGEIIENHNDEELPEGEEANVGVGLQILTIEGLDLDKEFKTDVYDYVVKVDKELTLEELEQLKEKIVATTNSDRVYAEVVAEVSEDGKRIITIIVKDDEKEYSRYTLTFEKEEEEDPKAVLMTDDMDNGTPEKNAFSLTPEQRVYIVLGCFGITFLMAMYFVCVSYLKSKRLAEYESSEDEDDENVELNKMNEYYVGAEKVPNVKEEYSVDTVSDVTSKLGKLNGYRSMRNGNKESGRHF